MNLTSLLAAVALATCATTGALAHEFKLGAISIGHPYARATAPGQPTGGAYLRLVNKGPDERLLSASSAIAERVELHSMKMEGDVMRMREVGTLDLPSGQTIDLKPGGLHLMLTGLKAPLKSGDRFPLTLKFEKGGEVVVTVNVETSAPPSAAAASAHDHSKH